MTSTLDKPLPDNIGTGIVTGRFGVVDGGDNFTAATDLTVTFAPAIPVLLDAGASPDPLSLGMRPVICTIDDDGYLCGPGSSTPGVTLVATDDTDLSATGWTYRVLFSQGDTEFQNFSIAVPSGTTIDLATVIPTVGSTGIIDLWALVQAAEAATIASAATAAAQASAAGVSQGAAAVSADAASVSATTAAGSATTAGTSASNAASSASGASTSASDAASSASGASTSATNAASSASAALTSKNQASMSAGFAAGSQTAAAGSATAASGSAANAATSETNAAGSATNALTSKNAAATSETNAAGSATTANAARIDAGNSASAALGSKNDAANSATAASGSATAASGSASAGLGSQTAASVSAGNAATSATAASGSATNAATSETNAAGSATNALASKNAAATSETNAGTSATAALVSRNAAGVSETNSAASAALVSTAPIVSDDDIAFTIADSNGRRSWVEIGIDGHPTANSTAIINTATAPAVAAAATAAAALTGTVTLPSPEAYGYLFAIVDSADRVALGVRPDGTTDVLKAGIGGVANGTITLAKLDSAVAARLPVIPADAVHCVGDSTTAAGSGYGGLLSAEIGGLPVTVTAVGGTNSYDIAARQGGLQSLCAVAGDSIPTSGPVTMTTDHALYILPGASSGVASATGVLAGVPGTWAHDMATNITTFTRTTAGSALYCPPNTPWIDDRAPVQRGSMLVMLSGRNSFLNITPAEIVRTIQAMIDYSTDRYHRVMVLGIYPGSAETLPAAPGSNRDKLNIANAALMAAFPNYWVPVTSYLQGPAMTDLGLTPTSQDTTDIANGVNPTSLMTDTIHLNSSGNTAVARYVARVMRQRGWIA